MKEGCGKCENLKNSCALHSENKSFEQVRETLAAEKLIKKSKRNIIRKVWDRGEGCIWGLVDGFSTGAHTGANVAGAGGWIAGWLGQVMGACVGAIVVGTSGAIVGLLSDKDVVSAMNSDYREKFGSDGKRYPRFRGNLDEKYFTLL